MGAMINKDNPALRNNSNLIAAMNPFQEKAKINGKHKQGLNNILFTLGMFALAFSIWLIGGSLWDDRYYVSEEGLGYWLGIFGGVLMLFALLYAFVKRKLKRNPVLMRYWFIAHTIFGIVGPFVILFHTTFQVGSYNGATALIATMLVFASGVIGRYFVVGVRNAVDNTQHDKFIKYVRHWRAIHIPLLYLLFTSGVVHVIAVHMY